MNQPDPTQQVALRGLCSTWRNLNCEKQLALG